MLAHVVDPETQDSPKDDPQCIYYKEICRKKQIHLAIWYLAPSTSLLNNIPGPGCSAPRGAAPPLPKAASSRSPCRREPRRRGETAAGGRPRVLGTDRRPPRNPPRASSPRGRRYPPSPFRGDFSASHRPLVFTRRVFTGHCLRFCQTSQAEKKGNVSVSAECLLLFSVVCSRLLCGCQNKRLPTW